MSELYEEMALFHSIGEEIYKEMNNFRGISPSREEIDKKVDYLKSVMPGDNSLPLVLAGMECTAHYMEHEEVAKYIGEKLDALTH